MAMPVHHATAELVRPRPDGGQQGAAGSRRHRAGLQPSGDIGTGPGRPHGAVETRSTTRNREQVEATALALPHAKSLMARVTVRTEWAGIEIQPLITQKRYDDAIHRITEYQQDLKQIKREAMYADRATRLEGTKAGHVTLGVQARDGVTTRRKARIAVRRTKALSLYTTVEEHVDRNIATMERLKRQAQEGISDRPT